MPAKTEPKRLFLVDEMAHIYRAFFATMVRMNGPGGLPTKVAFLFANILRRIIKDYQPEYLGIVFDPSGPTFRDKLFEKYKAHREPMPDEMRVQLPYVKKLCEAMRLPVLEMKGYEADDVIGTLALKGANSKLEVLIVSNDKDMMQLVGKSVRTLRTGSGGAKADVIVDEKRVEEILGVPPDRVIDYMALVGDTVDNIPGAKGIGEKGAAELIQKYKSVENALDHADEVPNKRYREALQQQREQVMLSKQLATIATDVPIEMGLDAVAMKAPDTGALAALYRELGFNSLLRELGNEVIVASTPEGAVAAKKDYAQLANAAEFREWLKKVPAKKPLAIWLNLDLAGRESEGFGTKVTGIEVSSAAGEGPVVWVGEKGEALQALEPGLKDAKRAKIVHDPKLFQLMLGETAGIEDATQVYSYLARPTTSKHDFSEVMFRQFNEPLGGGAGEHADGLQRLAPVLRKQGEEQKLEEVYEKIDLPVAAELAEMGRAGVAGDPPGLEKISASIGKEVRRLETEICKLAGGEFEGKSASQLGGDLFYKMELGPAGKRGHGQI